MAADIHKLRDQARAALGNRKYKDAAKLFARIADLDPANPRWSHKAAEALHKGGFPDAAIIAYEGAIARYAAQGFLLKAIAVCKMVLAIDPEHASTADMLATLYARRNVDSTELRNAAIKIGGAPRDAATGVHAAVPRAEPSQKATQASAPRVGAAVVAEAMRAAQADVEATRLADAEIEAKRAARTQAEKAAAQAAAEAEIEALRAASKAESSMRAERAGAMAAAQAEIEAMRAKSRALRKRRPTLVPGDSLDAVRLARVLPDARPHPSAAAADEDGSGSLVEIPLDEIPLDEDLLEELMVDEAAHDEDLEALGLVLAFEDVPPTPSSSPPPSASRSAARVDDQFVSHILRTLPPTPLFSSLDHDTLQALIERVEVVLCDEGEVVISEGSVGDALFVVVEGEVSLSREGREIGRLGESAFFGEVALLTEVEHTASVTALGECTLLKISREVISDLIEDHPEMLKVLLRFLRERLVGVLVATSKIFAPFAVSEREALTERFTLFEAEPNCTVLRRGQRPDALYVLLSGRAQLAAADAAPVNLEMGDIFGASSLLSGAVSQATVRTRSKCWLLRLERSVFREIIMTHPQVLEALSENVAAGYTAQSSDLETVSLELF